MPLFGSRLSNSGPRPFVAGSWRGEGSLECTGSRGGALAALDLKEKCLEEMRKVGGGGVVYEGIQ